MAEIRHLENRHDVIFFCWGWSDLDKISQTGAEWHVDCSDMVKIETRCEIPIWRTFGRIQWHAIPEPPATLQGAATWRIQCHDLRATCHIAGCCHRANLTACHLRATYHIAGCCHLVNSLSWFHVFRQFYLFIAFLNAVWALTSGGFRIVSDTLVVLVLTAILKRIEANM